MKNKESYINVVQAAWKKVSCEKMVKFLEGLNFKFVEFDYIREIWGLKQNLPPEYFCMVRMIHTDKDPKKDIRDFNLIIAIDLINRDKQVYFWLYGRPYKKGRKSWDKPKQVNFKPKKIGTKYPDWMSIQDRIDYRRIEKKIANRGVSKEEQAFFNKCYPAVKEINEKG